MPSRAPLATAHIALNKQTKLGDTAIYAAAPGALSILKEGIKTSKSASSIGRAGRESAGGAASRDYGQRNAGGLNEHRVCAFSKLHPQQKSWSLPTQMRTETRSKFEFPIRTVQKSMPPPGPVLSENFIRSGFAP